MQDNSKKTDSSPDVQALNRLVQARKEHECNSHIPPDYIVTGNCTFDAFSRYITQYPLGTFRAREAAQVLEWLYPLIKRQQIESGSWGLLDIIGEKPEKPKGNA